MTTLDWNLAHVCMTVASISLAATQVVYCTISRLPIPNNMIHVEAGYPTSPVENNPTADSTPAIWGR